MRSLLSYRVGQAQGVTVMVTCIEGWKVQVIANVPAWGKTMVFESPGLNITP